MRPRRCPSMMGSCFYSAEEAEVILSRFPPEKKKKRRVLIDVVLAKKIYDSGMNWREVGVELARRIGRRTPFQAESVLNAINIKDGKYPAWAERGYVSRTRKTTSLAE